jgi:RNA polymerase sigma-70 factor (ECF subfamily)
VKLENQEEAKILFQVIDSLSENQKTAFILTQIEDLPQQEVAEIMKITRKAVESLVQRAKANLKKELEKKYPNRGI